jgi:hypothetical protein
MCVYVCVCCICVCVLHMCVCVLHMCVCVAYVCVLHMCVCVLHVYVCCKCVCVCVLHVYVCCKCVCVCVLCCMVPDLLRDDLLSFLLFIHRYVALHHFLEQTQVLEQGRRSAKHANLCARHVSAQTMTIHSLTLHTYHFLDKDKTKYIEYHMCIKQ